MSNTEFTLYEVRDGAAWIILNRPEVRNSLSAGLVNELFVHLQTANADEAVCFSHGQLTIDKTVAVRETLGQKWCWPSVYLYSVILAYSTP
ncbi:MAG: enoyl-CoA hydratase/isomerase family protein [SAR324 cluster bacterium]|nr:enoyl-CoA hydratase/isomerase family protein [SAR324 cluster bacterium]